MARPRKGPHLLRRKDRPGYTLVTYTPDGRRLRRSLGDVPAADAELILEAARLQERVGRNLSLPELDQIFGKPAHRGTLEHFFVSSYLPWRARRFPASQARAEQIWRTHLHPHFQNAPLAAVDSAAVASYEQKRRREGAADGTLKKELDLLGAALRKACEWEEIEKMPSQPARGITVKRRRAPTWYTPDELERLLMWSPYHGPIWLLMANTGLRRAEALAARWRDVRDDRLYVEWRDGSRTKSGTWRSIPLNQRAWEALRYLGTYPLTRLPGEGEFLLPRIEPQSLSRAFKKCAERARLDGSIHCLRHTFCANLVSGGVPLRTVQVLAGHESIRTTEQYAHLADDHLAAAVAQLEL